MSVVRVAVLALSVLLVSIAAAQTEGLAERARELRQQQPADREQSLALQSRLAATADSLRRAGADALAAGCLESAGILAARRNDLDEAVALWERGLDWANAAGDSQSQSSLLNALAIGQSMRGNIDGALPLYGRTIELREALADTVGLSRAWGNVANIYANTGRLQEALEATTAEERWLASTDNRRGRIANALRRAQILVSLQRLDEALLWAERALALSRDEPGSMAHGLSWMRKGDVELELGDHERALESLERAVRILGEAGDWFTRNYAEQMRLIVLWHLGRYEESLQGARALERALDADQNDPLLTVMIRLQGHALFALGRRTEAESRFRDALARFEARRASLDDAESRAGIFHASGEIYAALARCHLAEGDVEAAFDVVERGRAPLFRDRTGTGQVDPARLREILTEQRAALVLFNDPRVDPLVAFVLHADGLEAVELDEVDSFVADARAAGRLLAAGESLEACAPILRRLGEALAAPVLERLPADVERSYVVPPSALIGFPLELLRDAEGRRWGERAPVSFLPNASALVVLSQRQPAEGGFLALADPELVPGVAAAGPLPVSASRAAAGVPLPHARREARAIAPRGGKVLTGDRATAEAIRARSGTGAAVLHLATHATVDPVDGSRSSILLAGPAGIEQLTAPEILDLDLAHDLVVLSGCSTFGRDRSFGEGWLGLPRSFLSAGSRSVLSTLWDVDDAGARRFVEAYYDELRAGRPRDLALAAARERARRAGLPPREWAAFVLSGLGGEPVPALLAPPSALPPLAWPLLGILLLLALRGLGARPADTTT